MSQFPPSPGEAGAGDDENRRDEMAAGDTNAPGIGGADDVSPDKRDSADKRESADGEHEHVADPFADLFADPAPQNLTRRAAREARQHAVSESDDEPGRARRQGRGRAGRRDRQPSYSTPKKSRKNLIAGLSAVAFFIVLVVIAGMIFIEPIKAFIASADSGPSDYPGPGTGEVTFTIHSGDIGNDIATNLEEAGVIANSKVFYKLLLSQMNDPVFLPGSYKLAHEMSSQEALDALDNPANRIESKFVIPEGTAVKDALPIIADGTGLPLDELTAAAKDYKSFGIPSEAPSLEGFLFPATYTLEPGMSAHEVLQTLVDRMFRALDEAGVPVKDRFRVVTLASIVQRESGPNPADAAKVARVFVNRLDKGWDLQSDATVAYGTGNTHRVETTDAEREDPSNPYNTYVHPGLPIGPISNPGDVAIEAAMHPAKGSWMFFVTWNLETGATIFSTTMAEHDAAVAKWQEWMKEHPGYG